MGVPVPAPSLLVARWFAAFNAHDFEALTELADPHIVVVPPSTALSPPGSVFHGHDGLESLVVPGFTRFPRLRLKPLRSTDVAGRTLVLFESVLDDGDGAPIRRRRCTVFVVRDGRIKSMLVYNSEDEALASLARDPTALLTRREREVLALLADGLSAEEVAGILTLSPLTVRTHIRNLRDKLGARNTVHAVAIALRDPSFASASALCP
jgi:DNA-binding CsgD family transcriptional regulator/ketosteroid isomerase-like protein